MAKSIGDERMAHTVAGTPFYMAPELMSEEGYSNKVDVWALGCLALCLAVPRAELQKMGLLSMMGMQSEAKRRKALEMVGARGERGKRLERLIGRMLEMDPGKRLTCREVMEDEYFEGYEAGELPEGCTGVDCATHAGGCSRASRFSRLLDLWRSSHCSGWRCGSVFTIAERNGP